MDERELRALEKRIQLDVVLSILAIGLQGPFLANALSSGGDTASWVLWGVILLFSAAVFVFAMRRAMPLSKKWRQHKWGEK